MEKEKITEETIIIRMVVAVAFARAIMTEEDAEDAEEAEEVVAEEAATIVSNCGKKGHYSTDCSAPRKNDNENSNMVSKEDFKNLFQYSLKEMLTKKEKQTKKKDNMEVDDESFDMNVFEKLMEGTHTEIVSNYDGDSKSINDNNTLSYSEQNNMTDKPCLGNNYNNNNDELAYPFSERIKLKHEPEKAQENKPVQYTADIIVEIKKREDGTVVPMIALLDT
jgi:hypothetical protein